MSRLRVLFVHTRYTQPGGEDVVFAAEAALLRSRGHEVVTWEENNAELMGVNALRAAAETVWSVRAQRRLRALLRDVRPDVVHFHNTFLRMSPAVYPTCREADVPVIQTLHNFRIVCPGSLLMRRGKPCEDCLGRTLPWPGIRHGCWQGSPARSAVVAAMIGVHRLVGSWDFVDVYVALTEFARAKFVEGGLPADRIVVKPNFVDPDPGPRDRAPGSFALFVGRLSPEKGVVTLLEAWTRFAGIPLRIVGSGPLLEEVRRRADGMPDVEVMGPLDRDRVLAAMKRTRFLVFPSECYENFPLAIAEAFACGLPVVASRLGAMAELVEDGRTGLLFEPGNPDDLAAKVDWAWTHPERMAEMGREARREYERQYTAERNYETLMDIYARAMTARR